MVKSYDEVRRFGSEEPDGRRPGDRRTPRPTSRPESSETGGSGRGRREAGDRRPGPRRQDDRYDDDRYDERSLRDWRRMAARPEPDRRPEERRPPARRAPERGYPAERGSSSGRAVERDRRPVERGGTARRSAAVAADDRDRPVVLLPKKRVGSKAPRTPAWWRDACYSITWLSILVVVCLWVANAGLTKAIAGDQTITQLGRLTALLSADLLLIQVVMMARVPFVERSYGYDDLVKRHRDLGSWAFYMLIAHLVLTSLGSAPTPTALLSTFWSFWPLEGIAWAMLGTAMIIAVMVTSWARMRPKLSYEMWHIIHLNGWLGVGFAVPHELALGGTLNSSPFATAYWWSIWLISAGAALIWRVILPLYHSRRHGVVVDRVVKEAPDVWSLYLRGRDLDRLNVKAGQFFQWRFLDGKESLRAHPFSISAAPRKGLLRITVKNLGDYSSRIGQMKPGTPVAFEGPYGRLTADARTRRKVVFAAAGIGITPVRALMEEMHYGPGEAVLLYRASSPDDLVFRHELDEIAARRGVRVHYMVGKRMPGASSWLHEGAGKVSDPEGLLRLVPDIEGRDVFVCGAAAWAEAFMDACLDVGVRPEQVHHEEFNW